MSDNLRIRTTPNGSDNYLNVKIEQDFDFIEILSLNISQDKVYETFCSDYGVIVGRVVINSGFGVPNVKVSVFIPIDDIDKTNPHISGLYPYETVNDKNSSGIRYNLLPKESDSQDSCYTPIGTFPAKREVLDNPEMLYVYKKYYKFTTQTNYAGDFMIFGVPLGNHVVHVDMDISNIGIASQRPYDLIDQGTPQKMFYSPTKFKSNVNINSLPQVKSATASVNVQPFWGDLNNCQIGINRLDFDMNYNIRPSAMFTGGIFGDNEKNSINKGCRPRKAVGRICEQMPSEGTIEMIRKTVDGNIESFDVDGGRVIDNHGAWAYQIPMNLDYVVTDESGEIIPSEDPNIGIPTRARVRFKISMDEGGGLGRLRTRAKYLVPHNPKNVSELDFNFDNTTNDSSFTDLHWNKIYTVKNFISKTKKLGDLFSGSQNYLAVKDVDACIGDKNPFPFNRTFTSGDVLFTILCTILFLISLIAWIFNSVICFLRGVCIPFVDYCPFGGLPTIDLLCPADDGERYFSPGCRDSKDDFMRCIEAVLAEKLGLYQFDFYNDWINGSLFFFLLKYKRKRNGSAKFCETYCEDFDDNSINPCRNNGLFDSTFNTDSDSKFIPFNSGHIVKYNDELFYAPLILGGNSYKLHSTDVVNLGAVFECDWQGFPKIINYLQSTTYKLPPLIAEASETAEKQKSITSGMFSSSGGGYVGGDGLFFDVNCLDGVVFNNRQAANIRRLCELSVDIPETIHDNEPTRTAVSIYDIYDVDDTIETAVSIHKYTRDAFTLLNITGSSISTYPPIYPVPDLNNINLGTSFNVTTTSKLSVTHSDGSLYSQFRNYFDNAGVEEDMAFQALGGSYYMYFGLLPGKTGLDKLNSKYFTPCIATNHDDYVIRTNVSNTSSSNGVDGSIQLTFIGGTAPFTYTVKGINYTSGPNTVSSTDTITGLAVGVYTITAIDALNTVIIKDVIVSPPLGLSCGFLIFDQLSGATANNGSVQISQLFGGTSGVNGYTLTVTNKSGTVNRVYTNASIANTSPIRGLSADTYTFTVTDSSNPVKVYSQEIPLIAPAQLKIGDLNLDNGDCFCHGNINPVITGGITPYKITYETINTTPYNGSTAYMDGNVFTGTSITGLTYSNRNINNLCKAQYKITVKDKYGYIVTKNFNIDGVNSPLTFIQPQPRVITNSGTAYLVYVPYDGISGGGGGYSINPSPDSSLGVCGEGYDINGQYQQRMCGFISWPDKITVTDVNNCSILLKNS